MTAADQPTTEPTTAAQALAQAVRESVAENTKGTSGPPNLATSYWEGYRDAGRELADLLDEPALLERYPALGTPLTPAPQPAAAPDVADAVQGEVWRWLNRHDAPWSPSDAKVLDLALSILSALALPAADTETEVQWGVQWKTGRQPERVWPIDKPNQSTLDRLARAGGTVVHCTRTPWEEA